MKKKFVLFIFLLLPLVLMGCNKEEVVENEESNVVYSSSQQQAISQADKVEVFYFYSSRRCAACVRMEEYTASAMQKSFQAEINDGQVVFKTINVEEVKNQDIVEKYKARGSSLFLNVIKDGKEYISEQIQPWRLLSNQEIFNKYIKKTIEGYL